MTTRICTYCLEGFHLESFTIKTDEGTAHLDCHLALLAGDGVQMHLFADQTF